MPNPADLTPSAVTLPESPLDEAVILDDATAEGEEIRCTIPAHDPLLATDPMPWKPYVGLAGIFYPKKDDRATIAYPDGGTPYIHEWWRSPTAVPDHSL